MRPPGFRLSSVLGRSEDRRPLLRRHSGGLARKCHAAPEVVQKPLASGARERFDGLQQIVTEISCATAHAKMNFSADQQCAANAGA